MKKIYRHLVIFSVVFIITLLTQAQNNSESVLVYERSGQSGLEYVFLSSQSQTFVPPQATCFVISQSGTYIAYLSVDGTTLSIARIDDSFITLQVLWQADWEPCNFIWVNDLRIAIFSTSLQTYLRFDILNSELSPSSPPPTYTPPSLPDRSPTDDIGVYIPSPTGNFYLYEMCSGTNCTGMGNYAIYDTAAQTNLVLLPDAAISTPHYAPVGRVNLGPEARWSYDGRFLAYPFVPGSIYNNFDLQLYDTSLLEVRSIAAPNWQIDYQFPISWSPVDYQLIFWIMGRGGEPLINDGPNLRRAIIYNANLNTITMTDEPYYVTGNIVWKPDGTAFVLTTTERNLIYVDVTTGASEILDTNVNRILGWRLPDN